VALPSPLVSLLRIQLNLSNRRRQSFRFLFLSSLSLLTMATTSLVTGLKVVLPVMFCLMLATLVYTIITDGLPLPDRQDVFTP